MAKLRYLLWLIAGILGIAAPRLLAETVDLKTQCRFAGRVADMNHTTRKFGIALRVGMKGLSYSGQLRRTLLQQTQPGKVTLWLGLRNVKLTVKRTNIVGGPGSAACGPMNVVIGQKKDLWLAFEIEADDEDGSSQMVVKDVQFQIPPDNWAIGRPAWVRVKGIGYTRQKVVNGIRRGIAKDRAKLQQKLARDAPQILSQVVKETTPENAKNPLVQAIRKRLQNPPSKTASLGSP